MNGRKLRRVAPSPEHRLNGAWIPSRKVEYGYYCAISYSTVAAYVGIEVPLLAAGILMSLAALCFVKSGARRREIYAPIALLLACQIGHVLVQQLAHDVFVLSDSLRWFILWIFSTIIVQSLCLRRGFLLRCSIVLFAIGIIAVPHLGFNLDVVDRARADIDIGGGLKNPNGLAAWFGFCVVSFGIAAIEMKRTNLWRWFYSAASILSLLVVALTVSRGALLGCALALTVGLRRLLSRAFIPLLLLICLGWLVFEAGLVNHFVGNYEERATEETGRFLLWPRVVDRIVRSPLVGVGVPEISTYVPERGDSISTPHNSFLFLALSSGFVPFVLFLGFWLKAIRSSFSDNKGSEYTPFRIPLLLYCLVAFLLADISAEPWSVLSLAIAAGPVLLFRHEPSFVGRQSRSRKLVPRLNRPTRASRLLKNYS
jgi:hypothetical protein